MSFTYLLVICAVHEEITLLLQQQLIGIKSGNIDRSKVICWAVLEGKCQKKMMSAGLKGDHEDIPVFGILC